MMSALKEKLKGTYFKSSLVLRACIAQLLDMERKTMMEWIAAGASKIDRIEVEPVEGVMQVEKVAQSDTSVNAQIDTPK